MIKSFFKIIKINKKEKINVIDINGHPIILIIPFIIRLIFKIPILMKLPIDFDSYIRQTFLLQYQNLRSKIINYSWFKFFRVFILRKIDFIRSLNEKMRKDLINLKFPERRILNIPNGINIKKFIEIKKKAHDGTNFAYIGRLTEFKNLRFLLDVLRIYFLKYPKEKFFIYGEGTEAEYINNFINNFNLSNNVFLMGFTADKDKIYSTIDVVIDPALAQGISNTNLEAMCTNTFLIASNVEGNRDLIIHGVSGLLFNPNNKEELLKNLIMYKENKNSVKKMIDNAKNEVLTKYDIDVITNKIYIFLKSRL